MTKTTPLAPADPDPAKDALSSRHATRGSKRLPRKITAQSLDNVALHYLSRFSAPSAHLKRVLLRRVDKSVRAHGSDLLEGRQLVEDLIARYCRSGLLDDASYAAGKARSLRQRGTSRVIIGRALRAKGLTAEHVETAMAGLETETGPSMADSDIAAAARLAQRKRLGPFRPQASRNELRNRDMAALARAGFGYDVARKTIDAESAEALERLIRGESMD